MTYKISQLKADLSYIGIFWSFLCISASLAVTEIILHIHGYDLFFFLTENIFTITATTSSRYCLLCTF